MACGSDRLAVLTVRRESEPAGYQYRFDPTGHSRRVAGLVGGIELLDHQHFTNSSMNDELLELSLRLLKLRRQMEIAEAQASGVNCLVNAVWRMGLLPRSAYLGPVIHTRPYSPQPGGHDSGQVFQASLLMPGGVGVSIWDTEELAELSAVPDGLESAAFMRHVPFEECEQSIRALLRPFIPLLTGRFLRALDWLQP